MKSLYFFLFCTLYSAIFADNWAVLVAGSKTWANYRHQADVCHAFRILHENGFPDSNIIVMMYDDIAFNKENLFPGVILNTVNGPNVYRNIPKDYVGVNVTVENFLAVLQGNKVNATGKVLVTGPNDHIFIYFADHGGPGQIEFPEQPLYAHELISTLKFMHDNDKYEYLVFYIEACESGSMFNHKLKPEWNIYATTAATPFESSWACCYDPQLQNYLGDAYSVNFLLNSDSYQNDWDETLEKQFCIVRNETTESRVCQYGNYHIDGMFLRDFIIFDNVTKHIKNKHKYFYLEQTKQDLVDVYDIGVDWLIRKYTQSDRIQRKEILKQLQDEFEMRSFYDKLFKDRQKQISSMFDSENCYTKFEYDTYCVKKKIESFESFWGQFSDYGKKYRNVLAFPCLIFHKV